MNSQIPAPELQGPGNDFHILGLSEAILSWAGPFPGQIAWHPDCSARFPRPVLSHNSGMGNRISKFSTSFKMSIK